jgi:hypothetical protein
MAAGRRPFLNARVVRTLDVLLIVWAVCWVLAGIGVGKALWDVGGIADPVIRNATGLSQATHSLDQLGSLPLVGGALGGAVGGLRAPLEKTRAEAQLVKDRVRQLAVVVALLLVLVPVLIALAFYLPLRIPWGRDVAAIREAMERDPYDPVLQRYLALRAVQGMRYDTLRGLSDDPWRDMEMGRARRLAEVELQRLGLLSPS